MPQRYDALLLVSFGGPEKHEDVIPFLENVLRGKNVPRERMLEVAEHYYHFDGRSPINDQCRALISALKADFAGDGIDLPIYWGNRNWHPMLADTVRQMQADGVTRALALVTSAFSSYSGCRQYQENVADALQIAGAAFEVEKIPSFYSHPGFTATMADRVRDALAELPGAMVVYTAHSIPVAQAVTTPYETQLREACGRINGELGLGEVHLMFQSRSGPPTQPWLSPDIGEFIRGTDAKRLVVVPIGFLSDHMEVLFDLDTEAVAIAKERGIEMVRAKTPGTHPRFVQTIRELVLDAQANGIVSICRTDCCQAGRELAKKSS